MWQGGEEAMDVMREKEDKCASLVHQSSHFKNCKLRHPQIHLGWAITAYMFPSLCGLAAIQHVHILYIIFLLPTPSSDVHIVYIQDLLYKCT